MFQKQSNQQVQKLNIKLTLRLKNASYMLAFLFLGYKLERVKFRVWRRLGRAERNPTQSY